MSVILDGNVFLIRNYKYSRANIANWEGGLGTYEERLHPDQFWLLEESRRFKGYYYIRNTLRDTRIAKTGSGDGEVGVTNGKYYDDQLWRFERHTYNGSEVYRIWNKTFTSAKLAKWGKGDGDFGSYSRENHDDQLWFLIPKYQAKLSWKTIFSADNRTGSKDFSREETVTVGLKLSNSQSLSTKLGVETALTASTSPEVPGSSFSTELSRKITSEITTSMSSSSEQTWSTTTKTTFTAPAGKNYRVRQRVIGFDSQLPQDDMLLHLAYHIDETTGEFTD